MWFDSRPNIDSKGPINSYAYPTLPKKTIQATPKMECSCSTRLLKITLIPPESLAIVKDFLLAFGECNIREELNSIGQQQLFGYFFDSRDAVKAMDLLPKFPECKDCVITPVEQEIKTLHVPLPQEVTKEELWYEVSKYGDIAWSSCDRVAGQFVVTYLMFDIRCNIKLLQAPLVVNNLCLHVAENIVPHNLACRLFAKDTGDRNMMKEIISSNINARLPSKLHYSATEFNMALGSYPVLPNSSKRANFLGMLASPPHTEAASDASTSSSDDLPALTGRRGSRMDFFGQLTPPLNQDAQMFSPAISPPTIEKKTEPLQQPPPPPPAAPLANAATGNKSNKVDLDLIRSGSEFRTTVMLRNIPNKVNLTALRTFLDETNKNTYDFLYLRMDFNNKCNVGYAFINFTHPDHIATLTKARRGKKWSQYNSIKIIDVSFANIQGRRALIEKFRDSPIMNMDREYRPKLYYTTGKLAGEEEDFP